MTELGTDNLGSGQGTWHNHVSRPKLSLDFDAPNDAMEVHAPSSAAEVNVASGAPAVGANVASEPPAVGAPNNATRQQDSVTPVDSAQAVLAAEQARQAAVRAAEAAAAAAAARAAQNNVRVNVATPNRHFDVETEPSAEYEKVEDYELEEGAVEPELPEANSVQVRTSTTPTVRPIAVKAPGHAISVRTEASNATDAHAGASASSNRANFSTTTDRPAERFSVTTADRPAERHPYQVHAAEARAARRQLEEQIRHATHPTVSTQERKDIAIARALAAVQPIEQENDVLARNVSSPASQLDTTRSKRQKHKKEKSGLSTGRRFALAFAVAAVAVTGLGVLIMNSVPDISLQVAAMQVGIDATYPAYVPRGFSMTNVTSADGRIRLTFSNNETTFVITESQSSWDTSAVLNNYVKPEWPAYTTTHENGITVYINNSNAAWVNGGIFYTIECETGALTKKQLTNIVAGL